MTMRDAFFFNVFKRAKVNPDIIVLTSDFSAPSFDRFRIELPGQFINTGISEQNTILVAAGLACSGKKVFVTSIAPFITMRCFEQTRLYAADMNLDIKIAAVGAGFSYNTAGPTHHSVEDIALFRTLPHMRIFMPSCNSQVKEIAEWCSDNPGPAYIRLDRMPQNELYDNNFGVTDTRFCVLKQPGDVMFIADGYMVHTALKAAEELREVGINAGVTDLYGLPVDGGALINSLINVKRVITVEEHVYSGGIGSYLCELMIENNCANHVKRFALDVSKGYYHLYGTRDEMHDACGIGVKQLVEYAKIAVMEGA